MRGKVFTIATSVALLSCRAVLGIEDIDEPADAGKAQTDSGPSGKDAGPDGTTPATDAGACGAQAECGKCCRDNDKPSNKIMQDALKECLCNGGCPDCASTDICVAGGVMPGAGAPNCIPCIDDKIKNNQCEAQKTQCFADPGCKAVYDCIHSCP